MPIYEYQCEECEHIEEVLQKGTDGFYFLGKGCPNCGSKGNMTRMISVGSFHLKGGGWQDKIQTLTILGFHLHRTLL